MGNSVKPASGAGAQQLVRALEIVELHNVPLTEELADQLAPPPNAEASPQAASDGLQRVAKVARKQGLFHVAAKKYTQVCVAGIC